MAHDVDCLRKLVEQHPRLFRGEVPYVASWLAPGWAPLVEKLFDDIEGLLDDERAARFCVHQIKEKFGALRVYACIEPAPDMLRLGNEAFDPLRLVDA